MFESIRWSQRFFVVAVSILAVQSAANSEPTLNSGSGISTPSGADEDLGFNTNIGGTHVGSLATHVNSSRDMDARFIINDVPISYHTRDSDPKVRVLQEEFAQSITRARENVNKDSRALALLLEGAASMYRKQNRNWEALELQQELVSVLRRSAPGSDELVAAELTCGQTACACQKFNVALDLYQDALKACQQAHEATHELTISVQQSLYNLYFELDQLADAIACREHVSNALGKDPILDKEQVRNTLAYNTWPDIINTVDAVSTAQELEDSEKRADAEAAEVLKATRQAEQQADEKARKEKEDKQKDKKDAAESKTTTSEDSHADDNAQKDK